MKKKIVAGILIMVTTLSMGGIMAFAAKPVQGQSFVCVGNVRGGNYQGMTNVVSGINVGNLCGGYGAGLNMSGFVTARAAGNYGAVSQGGGYGYVDANGDGICDNYGTGVWGGGYGYVDANGDGICDNYGTGVRGGGYGRNGGQGGGRGRCGR